MRIFDLAAALPWAITEESLRTILQIAARENPDIETVAAQLGRPLDNTRTVTVRDGVAIIPVTGYIFRRANLFTEISGGTSTEVLAQDFARAIADPSVLAILFDIDSPGGEATGINELAETIAAARGKKPTCAYGDGLVASGAYWMASACETIVVDAIAGVGSIGVVMAVRDPSKVSARDLEFVSSQSPRKRADPLTEAGKQQYQRIVDSMAEAFVAAVARNRGVSEEVVLSDFGQGGIVIGRYAVEAGLADRLGGFEDTLSWLSERGQQLMDRTRLGRGATRMEDSMNWNAFWGGLIGAAQEAEGETPPAIAMTAAIAELKPEQITTDDPRPITVSAATDTQLTDEIVRLRAELAAQQQTQIAQVAAAFADEMIRDKRAVPAEREQLVALYTQAAADDAAHPIAVADDGAPASRTTALRATISARPAHIMTTELLPVRSGGGPLPSSDLAVVATERTAALLALSPLGQAALKQRS